VGQHIAEVNPAVENEMVRQEDQRADLSKQARRANDAFISRFMPEQEHQQHLARIRKEKEAADARLSDLLGASVVSAAVSDGLAWETWAPIKKRNFLSHFGRQGRGSAVASRASNGPSSPTSPTTDPAVAPRASNGTNAPEG
jgi:hypothetical protein